MKNKVKIKKKNEVSSKLLNFLSILKIILIVLLTLTIVSNILNYYGIDTGEWITNLLNYIIERKK